MLPHNPPSQCSVVWGDFPTAPPLDSLSLHIEVHRPSSIDTPPRASWPFWIYRLFLVFFIHKNRVIQLPSDFEFCCSQLDPLEIKINLKVRLCHMLCVSLNIFIINIEKQVECPILATGKDSFLHASHFDEVLLAYCLNPSQETINQCWVFWACPWCGSEFWAFAKILKMFKTSINTVRCPSNVTSNFHQTIRNISMHLWEMQKSMTRGAKGSSQQIVGHFEYSAHFWHFVHVIF